MKFIKADEVPYDELKQVGISEKAFLNMPKEALDRMLSGRTSPLMELNYQKKDGNVVSFVGKLGMQRDADGKVHLTVIPRIENQQMLDKLMADKGLTPEDIKNLQKGEMVVKEVGKERQYFRLDRETNSVVSIRQADIMIPNSIGDVQLGNNQKERLREGKPIELSLGDTKVTVGVDPNDVTGCRVIKGDMHEWETKQKVDWDRGNMGVTGYWRCAENSWQLQELKNIQQGRGREETFSQRYAREHAVDMSMSKSRHL